MRKKIKLESGINKEIMKEKEKKKKKKKKKKFRHLKQYADL